MKTNFDIYSILAPDQIPQRVEAFFRPWYILTHRLLLPDLRAE